MEDYQYDGNHCIATDDPQPVAEAAQHLPGLRQLLQPAELRAGHRATGRIRCGTYRVMYQVYGMAGLVKSVMTGFGWLKSLWRGPVTKMQDVPRRRLEMVPPPVSPASLANPSACKSFEADVCRCCFSLCSLPPARIIASGLLAIE